jgi:hypothetical protein
MLFRQVNKNELLTNCVAVGEALGLCEGNKVEDSNGYTWERNWA